MSGSSLERAGEFNLSHKEAGGTLEASYFASLGISFPYHNMRDLA